MTLKADERAGQVIDFWDNKARALAEWQRRIDQASRPSGDMPSAVALNDRDERASLPETRSLSGILLGDPPAGRSALDRKKMLAAERGCHWTEVKD
jgi:hypothetical protein